ncbi:serine/threonine-protein kinase phg2 [Anastrepha ludens]|uniref:serine/threonine-protein kinase phg2 n=1 Tax=Anastrepha ludens TaxID=28586 RepID=UPI0023AFA535|nr:serine/threonine-protein kinase phg2 [Anastrepha ludens]
MWIPSVLVILPKTLLKWTTPHCKSATKFKTKIVKPQLQAETVVVAATTTTTIIIIFVAVIAPIISRIETEETVTAAAFSSEQHCRKLFVESSLVTSSSSSSSSLVSLCALVLIFFIGRFIHRSHHFLLYAVTLKLAFLMNDIRLKSLRKPTKILITTTAVLIEQIIALTEIATTKALKAIRTVLIGSKQIKQLHNNKNNNNNNSNNNNNQLTILAILSKATTTKTLASASATRTKITTTQITNSSEATSTPILPSINSKNNITVAALVALRLFNKNSFSSNNHRTYNNGSKSNKVFLHYTPRDPRLRIANSNQEILINKHHFDSVSELKITEDLCAYGELIGGFFSTPATFKIVIANLVYCDCNQINCCCNHNNNNRNNSESKSKSENEIENKFIVSDSTQRQLIYDKYSCKLKSREEKEAQLSQRQQSSISIVNFVRNLQLGPKYLQAVTSAVGILL